MKFKKSKNRGFSLIEVIIATAICSVVMVSSMSVTQRSVSFSHQAVHTSQAALLLEEGVEVVRILRDNGWSNITGLSTATTYYPAFSAGNWSLSPTSSVVDIFTRTVTFASVYRNATTGDISASGNIDTGARLATITVSWKEGNQTLTKSISFYIMDIFS